MIKTLTVSDGDGDPVDVSCSVTPVDEAYKFVHEADSAYYAMALRFLFVLILAVWGRAFSLCEI